MVTANILKWYCKYILTNNNGELHPMYFALFLLMIMKKLAQHLLEQIKHYQFEQHNFVIGLSGGLDSTALLALFVELRTSQPNILVRAIHVHHGLSPNADHWLYQTKALCNDLQVPYQAIKVNLEKSGNIEANARTARYQAFQKSLQSNEVLVTAHHQDDQCETLLLALKRGSGVKGLSAMAPLSQHFGIPLFRPLLNISRQQLKSYLETHQLNWIHDESNDEIYFDRNFLRKQIIPQIDERWPHFKQMVSRSAELCSEQQSLINELLEPIFLELFSAQDESFDITSFATFSVSKQNALLRHWLTQLKQTMPSRQQLAEIINTVINARQDAQPQYKLNQKVIRRYAHKLFLTDEFNETKEWKRAVITGETINLPDNLGTLNCQQLMNGDYQFSWHSAHSTILLTLLPPPAETTIQIAFQYSGRLHLNKNGSHRLIKHIWQQFDIPPWQRQRIPLIFYGEQLQAAMGLFEVYHK